MGKVNIFLSYRRDDSEADTRNIRVALEQAGHRAFMDRAGIDLGENWPDRIKNALKDADIVLAIMGNAWLTSCYPDGRRRIDVEEDWVRQELRMALQANKLIIPVLINRAPMPAPPSLPADLREFSNRQAFNITRENWDSDVQNLVQKITAKGKDQRQRPMLLLTSNSPRRKELLKQIGWTEGVDYFTMHASVNLASERRDLHLEEAKRIAARTARKKIEWVMARSADIGTILGHNWNPSSTILIGVDTIVFCNNEILDRPLLQALHLAGPEDLQAARTRAKQMLMEQKGQRIHIITSLAIALASTPQTAAVETIVTEAELREYSEEDIDNYISDSEPFDKAGAFGIQEKGISLFKKIRGSYTNVVGLPLHEFNSLLGKNYGKDFALPELKSVLPPNIPYSKTDLSVACVGDINYDYIYDKFPEHFFAQIQPPGYKFMGQIHRAVGGTAVNFAKGASKAGFVPCYVIGIIGGDALGREILEELNDLEIQPIATQDPNVKTSIAIIFRDAAEKDTSITITDAHQSLPDFVVGMARATIEKADVFYCSGYCLLDMNRHDSAVKMMEIAKQARQLVVLDIVVGMNKHISWENLAKGLSDDRKHNLVDVIASELPEIFAWLGIATADQTEMETWELHKDVLVQKLREKFQVAILRTSNYTHEITVTSDEIIGPTLLDYRSLGPLQKVGYGDFRTAQQMYSFLSPRVVLASKSPQRFDLLSQIVAPSKIEVVVSNSSEERLDKETPHDRVQRLALKKAEAVFQDGNYHDDIELIIGADTEIIRRRDDDEWEMIGHPQTIEEAVNDLTRLNNKSHFAITGIAVIGRNPETGKIKRFTDYVETRITFDNLTPEQIRAYAETGEPIARAGAYAIQGLATMLIEELDGSYSNVVGLPLERLSEVLTEEFKKPIWLFDKVSNWTFPHPIKPLRSS